MIVNNKYQIGDKVYFINVDNKAKCDEVKAIYAYIYSDHVNICYGMQHSGESYSEAELFRSEAELKEDVFKDLIEFV